MQEDKPGRRVDLNSVLYSNDLELVTSSSSSFTNEEEALQTHKRATNNVVYYTLSFMIEVRRPRARKAAAFFC